MVKINTCVFISGKGSNLKRLILNSIIIIFQLKIKLVVSSNKKKLKVSNLQKSGLFLILILNKNQSLSENKILIQLKTHNIDLILLQGI